MKDRISNESSDETGMVEFDFRMEALTEFGARLEELVERHGRLEDASLGTSYADAVSDEATAIGRGSEMPEPMSQDMDAIIADSVKRVEFIVRNPEAFVSQQVELARTTAPELTEDELAMIERAARQQVEQMTSGVDEVDTAMKDFQQFAAAAFNEIANMSLDEDEDEDDEDGEEDDFDDGEEWDDDEGEDEENLWDDEDAEESVELPPGVFHVEMEDGAQWTDAHAALITRLEDNWSEVRSRILEAVFERYKEDYPEIWEMMGGEPYDKVLLPDPVSPEVVTNLFSLHTIHLGKDANIIGFEGECTWDDEHGVGIRIEGDEVIAGGADEAFLPFV